MATTVPQAGGLTIIMYHYVRPLEGTRYPDIKGLRLSEFKFQLDHVKSNFHMVTVAEVVHSLRTGDQLPSNSAMLTFDDGYIDHYANVFPLLHEAKIQGAFFPPVASVERGELLDVNRVHFILASTQDKGRLRDKLDAAVLDYRQDFGLDSSEEYWARYGHANRFDTAEVIYIKRMLQVALPETLRNRIARELFAKFVSGDEKAFAGELYMTIDQLRTMQRSDMYIGSHGDSHYWLDSIDERRQREEVESSLKFLRRVGSPVDDYWVMCYPYGSWNKSLLDELRRQGCTLGLTTDVGVADLRQHDPLLLPRLDTNDLPKR